MLVVGEGVHDEVVLPFLPRRGRAVGFGAFGAVCAMLSRWLLETKGALRAVVAADSVDTALPGIPRNWSRKAKGDSPIIVAKWGAGKILSSAGLPVASGRVRELVAADVGCGSLPSCVTGG